MASTYSLVDYDSEEERVKDPTGPPGENLFAAAAYIETLLSTNDLVWAIMGGYALICCGSRRETRDIDMVVATTVRNLWKILETRPRLARRSNIRVMMN